MASWCVVVGGVGGVGVGVGDGVWGGGWGEGVEYVVYMRGWIGCMSSGGVCWCGGFVKQHFVCNAPCYTLLHLMHTSYTPHTQTKPTHSDTIRLAPPLIITHEQVVEAAGIIRRTIESFD